VLDVKRTVISQYGQSPTIRQLIENMDEYIDPTVDMAEFYRYVWNVDTAVGFGLDIWGRIVGVTRLLRLTADDPILGFDNPSSPPDWRTFGHGRFYNGVSSGGGQAYELPDDAFRVLILTKALANIVATNARSLNQLLKNLFPGRGRVYVRDLGGMAMQFVFNFPLTPVEYAIIAQSGALPHPAGVFYSVVVAPSGRLFGFRNTNPGSVKPFNYGEFNSRPA
jgi:Protein of unknown function (DUF2612)